MPRTLLYSNDLEPCRWATGVPRLPARPGAVRNTAVAMTPPRPAVRPSRPRGPHNAAPGPVRRRRWRHGGDATVPPTPRCHPTVIMSARHARASGPRPISTPRPSGREREMASLAHLARLLVHGGQRAPAAAAWARPPAQSTRAGAAGAPARAQHAWSAPRAAVARGGGAPGPDRGGVGPHGWDAGLGGPAGSGGRAPGAACRVMGRGDARTRRGKVRGGRKDRGVS